VGGQWSNAATGELDLKSRQTPELGLREQHKLEKRQRIRAAARDLFSKHGYETATLRQIAQRAHVGLGTLFNYAQDKRDLVFLIFNEELAAVADEAVEAARTQHSLLGQLLGLCRPHYKFFARNPVLSRILLRDMTFYSEGKQAAEFLRIRARLLAVIEEVVQAEQRNGGIRPEEDAWRIANCTFFIFAGALRWWIAERKPDPRKGLAEVRCLFELLIDGLRASPAASANAIRPARISAASR
jgi:AcrR family transcriptional regulator